MLDDNGIPYRYRDYRRQPLSEHELWTLFMALELRPRDLLRRRDRIYRELDLTGNESDDHLVRLMAAHPTLLERPIGVVAGHAVVGRPPEKLLRLVAKGPPVER